MFMCTKDELRAYNASWRSVPTTFVRSKCVLTASYILTRLHTACAHACSTHDMTHVDVHQRRVVRSQRFMEELCAHYTAHAERICKYCEKQVRSYSFLYSDMITHCVCACILDSPDTTHIDVQGRLNCLEFHESFGIKDKLRAHSASWRSVPTKLARSK